LQDAGQVDPEEMARTFNCGIGMVLIIDRGDVALIEGSLSELREHAIYMGDIVEGHRGCTVRGGSGDWASTRDWSAKHNV
jgi:phosphoribosylformylglycinamidine cyclo-ligase